MAAIPIQRSWTVGEIVVAAYMNSNVRDAVTFALNMPSVVAYNTLGLTLNDQAWSLVGLQAELHDKDPNGQSAHSVSVNSSRATFLYPGSYEVTAYGSFAQDATATGERHIMVRTNSAGSSSGGLLVCEDNQVAVSRGLVRCECTFPYDVTAADAGTRYLEMFMWQNHGSPLDIVTGTRYTGMDLRLVSG